MTVIKYKRIFNVGSSGGGGITSIVPGTNISVDNTDPANPIVSSTADDITVVANYSALPVAGTVTGQFYWCSASQGTAWLPFSLGGTYYSAGLYYSNGVTWEFMAVPYQATQAEVNTGTNTDKFVTPATLTSWTGRTLTIGTTTITSGTNGKILYNNSGILGNFAGTADTVLRYNASGILADSGITDNGTNINAIYGAAGISVQTAGGTTVLGDVNSANNNTLLTIIDSAATITLGANNGIFLNNPTTVAGSLTAAKIISTSTIEQLRVGYSAGVYWNATTDAAGLTTISATGGTTNFLFNKNVQFGVGSVGASGLAVDIHEGTARWAIGKQVGASNEIVLYGRVTPSNTNFALLAGATTTQVNAVTAVYFSIGGTVNASVYGSSMGVNIGGVVPSAKMHIRGTTEQLRLDYDVSNYYSTTVSSAGAVTFDAVGASAGFTFSDKLNLSVRANFASVAGTTVEGDVWSDSTQKALQTFTNGIEQTLSGCIFTQTANKTIANTVTETTLFGTGVGTLTLPANFWVAGKTIRIIFHGTVADTGTPTIRIRGKLGATTIVDSTALTLPTVSGTEEYRCEVVLTCRTTGVGGTVTGSVWFLYDTTASGGEVDALNVTPATTAFNTTVLGALDLTVEWGTASASNTITSYVSTVEILN